MTKINTLKRVKLMHTLGRLSALTPDANAVISAWERQQYL